MGKDSGCAELVLLFLLAIVLVVMSVVLNGYALSILWGWFVVTTFGLPALSIPAAIGLSIVVTYMTYQGITNSENSDSPGMLVAKGFAIALLRPALALALGWVITLFM